MHIATSGEDLMTCKIWNNCCLVMLMQLQKWQTLLVCMFCMASNA